MLGISLLIIGVLIDALTVLRLHLSPLAIEFIVFADIPIFMASIIDLVVEPKRTKELGLATLTISSPKIIAGISESLGSRTPTVRDERFRVGTVSEAKPMKTRKVEAAWRKKQAYQTSPQKLKAPAFMCRCGHPHRFVCLTCGMTTERALKKKGMRWLEWLPEMGALP